MTETEQKTYNVGLPINDYNCIRNRTLKKFSVRNSIADYLKEIRPGDKIVFFCDLGFVSILPRQMHREYSGRLEREVKLIENSGGRKILHLK